MSAASLDYSTESAGKVLGIDDLVEVILEYIHHLGSHNVEYVKTRILLLAAEFEIEFKWPVPGVERRASMLENLIYGDNPIPRKILPFDKYLFLEGPPEEQVDIYAYFAIREIEKALYEETYSNLINLQRRYLTLLIERLLPPHVLQKKILLLELIDKGLPVKEEAEFGEEW